MSKKKPKAVVVQVSSYRTIKVPKVSTKQARAKDKANDTADRDTFFTDVKGPPNNTAYDALGAALQELSLPDVEALEGPSDAAAAPPPIDLKPIAAAAALIVLGLIFWKMRK
jgi:hypothetical protein